MVRFALFLALGALAAAPAARAQQLQFSWSPAPAPIPIEGFGISLAGAGDVNGDGHPDVLVGSDGAYAVGHPYANVYSGGDGTLLFHFVLEDKDPLPIHVAGVGDLNADGYDDVIVGTGAWNDGIGLARVYSGADGSTLYEFISPALWDGLGESVCGTGDVDGDGVPDFAIGSIPKNTGAPDPGRVRVYSGKTGLLLHELVGLADGDQFGKAIANAGDVNADGTPDLIVGAIQGGSDPGYARAYWGGATLGYHLTSPHAGVKNFGAAVGTPGDLDLDGHMDLIVGAPDSDDLGTPSAGRVDIYSGATGNHMSSITSGMPNTMTGFSVFGVGDADLDGEPDFGIGSRNVVALFGGSGALLLYPSLGLTEAGASPYGLQSACAGDLDGDGIAEVVLTKRPSELEPKRVDAVSLLPIGTQLYGASSPSCRGPHRLRPATQPVIGNGIFHLDADRVAQNGRGILLVSPTPDFVGSDSLSLGFPIYVGIDAGWTSQPLLHEWNQAPTQPGYVAARFAIPDDPLLVGRTYYLQGLFVERRVCEEAPLGMGSSDAVAITIQPY